MNKKIKLIFGALFAFNLTFCAYSKEENPGIKQEEEDRNRLLKTFSNIAGNYSGKLITHQKEFPVQLRIFILYLQDGKNAAGFEVVRPVLRASLYQTDPPKPHIIFNVSYKAEYQTLQMISNTSASTGTSGSPAGGTAVTTSDGITTIDAQIVGQNITGIASRSSGPAGRLELILQDRTSLAPSEGDTNKFREDLRNYFQKISGEYVGNVTPPPQKAYPYEIIIKLSSPASGDNNNPELRGFFIRTDTEDINLCNGRVNVTYLNEYTPPRILIESPAELKTSPCYISIDGVFGENKIIGTFYDREGDASPIELKKR